MSHMIGSFAELNSGGPQPFVAQLIDWNHNTKSFLCKWLWRPGDLPQAVVAASRPLTSFGDSELLMCTSNSAGADWNPRDALLKEHVRVLPYDQWLKQNDVSVYFYRQIYDVAGQQLRPRPEAQSADLALVQLDDGSQVVHNPHFRYFQCPHCGLLFDGSCLGTVNVRKAKASDGPLASACTSCAQTTWKSIPLPPDEKRQAVVDRIVAGLELAVKEAGEVPAFLAEAKAVSALACAIEDRLASELGELTKDYKSQARAVIFNLTDAKNTSFRNQVISGSFPLWRISRASADELASQSIKETREAEREKYFHEQVVVAAADASIPRPPSPERSPSPISPKRPQRQASSLATAPATAGPVKAEQARKRAAVEKTASALLAELDNLKDKALAERMRKFISSELSGDA